MKILKNKYMKLSLELLSLSLVLGACSCNNDIEEFSTDRIIAFNVQLVDDLISNAKIEALECDEGIEQSKGNYTLMCSSKPKILIAKGGYYTTENNEIHTIDLPLVLNTELINNEELIITPATTMVANLSSVEEVYEFALSIGLNLTSIYDIPTQESQNLFRYLNLINTLAAENGVKDIILFRRFLVNKIKAKGAVDTFDEAILNVKSSIEDLKNNKDLLDAFSFGTESFLTEVSNVNTGELEKAMKQYEIADNKVVFTGFIYDKLLPFSSVTATLNGIVIGTTQADKNAKWKMALDTSNVNDDSLIIITAILESENVEFKTMISQKEIGKSKKVNLIDNSSLLLSNITTAEYVMVDNMMKIDENSSSWNAEDVLKIRKDIKETQSDTLMELSAAIKVIVDTNLSVSENTLEYAMKITKMNDQTKESSVIHISFEDYNDSIKEAILEELPKQIVIIKEDEILNNQRLKPIEEEKIVSELKEELDSQPTLTGAISTN